MSKDGLANLRSAHEEEYFQRKNQEALARIAEEAERTRMSPVANVPMIQETLMGVVIDRCPQSGGIWLDAGELEEIIASHVELLEHRKESNFLSQFIRALTKFDR